MLLQYDVLYIYIYIYIYILRTREKKWNIIIFGIYCVSIETKNKYFI